MVIITATELKQNLGKYIALSQSEDVIVKKNGKIVTTLTSAGARQNGKDALLSLAGKYEYFDYKAYLDERDSKR